MTSLISAINIALAASPSRCVIKFGVYPNPVGLQVFDQTGASAMQRAFKDRKNSLGANFRGDPIYVGHPDDADWARENPGASLAAVGRIRDMQIGRDGLHLLTAYNDDGKRLVGTAAPAYVAFSPNWGMQPIVYQGGKAFRPVRLYSIGLTNKPNIPGTSIGLNTQEARYAGSSESPSAARISAISQAVRAKMNSANLSHHDAYRAVERARPDLFMSGISR